MSAHTESLDSPQANNISAVQLGALLQNLDQNNLVAPLREVYAAQSRLTAAPENSQERCRAALALQEKWEGWLVQRELLRNDLKRGKELLENTQEELARLRSNLEEWSAYERVCGKNPVVDYMQSIAAQERIEAFLPAWLKRRESELATLSQALDECARQNGLEHLL